ncbi:unnamed protein product [Candidula unifasciata]|uniref:Uncharacterized protein n=1 Tax=Candidula unifasciata TaxID=100452 RepID=A0A8S3ZKU6_9EUPU|nr:unnamed protein product [Candidula unifasciata]
MFIWRFVCVWMLCVSFSGAICPYQECSCGGFRISCQNRGLTSMPSLLTGDNGTDYTVLYLDGNNITSIPARSLPPGLKEISLSNNSISHIDNTAWDGSSSTLRKLTFNRANFTKIPDAFLHLEALEILEIYNSVVVDWNEAAMNHLGKRIQTLYLQNVGLTEWPAWIRNFSNINQLSVLYCSISQLPDDALDNLHALHLLSIIHCELEAIPKTVSNIKSLQLLQLLQNNITDITWLPASGYLSSLNLNTNSISDPVHLGTALRPLADILRYINLKQNKLTIIPDLPFMTNLGELDLSYNLISDTESGSMPEGLFNLILTGNLLASVPRIYFNATSVTYIYLGFNQITTIQDTDFPPWIIEANLESNYLTEIRNSSFPENSSLVFLDLSGNPIIRIDTLAFFNLTRLIHLNLHQTKLTRMPLALSRLTGLKLLDVRDNPELVCSCAERSLESWIKELLTVAGDCGITSVQDFYDTLGDLCPI